MDLFDTKVYVLFLNEKIIPLTDNRHYPFILGLFHYDAQIKIEDRKCVNLLSCYVLLSTFEGRPLIVIKW